MGLGAQLFTLRDYCKDLSSFAETLKRVADMGYKTVQVSGTCAYEAQWLADELQKNDLRCVLTHTPMDKIRDNTAQVIAEHQTFGCKYVGIGCAPNCFAKGEEDMKALCDTIDAAGKPLADSGMLLMYHNHACEDAGTIHLLVEQDDCYEDPFVCMKKSYDFLHARGL